MRTLILSLLAVLFLSCRSSAQDAAGKIDQLLGKYFEYGQFNGAALVAKDGKVVFKKGYGYANFEWDVLNTVDTKFRLGSITKQFTAMLILKLAQSGKLQLDGKVADYLPYYPKENGNKITIYQLLTHTAGVPNYTNQPDFFASRSRNPYTPKEFIPVFSELPLDFVPGSKFSYSNSGYFVLGAIIEQVTGKPYETFLQDSILTPLKMTNTGYDHSAALIKKRAAGYAKRRDGYENADYLDMSLPYAAGSMYSTIEDLYLWDQGLHKGELLNQKYMQTYFTPFKDNYACGWINKFVTLGNTKDTLQALLHGGGINGFTSLIVRIPDSRDLVVLLNNTGGTDLDGMARNILAILDNKTYDQPVKSPALPAAVQKMIAATLPDTAAYRTYTGRYELFPGVYMAITTEGEHIYEQLTNQNRFEIFPKGSGVFFMRVVEAEISFFKNDKGVVDRLVLHQNGRDMPGKKISE